ncbi:hypothetical protein LZ32DRAFT_588216 [Colletotrichum eremochloae]|nr:hypothetical protein LZ32DRAFT_588216 [Colletotrichum eremochloae]
MADNPRLTFGASCNKAMFQHIIRHRLRSSECAWKSIDELKSKMYLVRPDGSSWGATFDQLALPRLTNALKGRHRLLVQAGAAAEGDRPWAPWVDGLLHPDWSGIAKYISQEVGEALLKSRLQDAPPPQQQPELNGPPGHVALAVTPPQSAIIEPSVVLEPDDSVSVANARRCHAPPRRRCRPNTRSICEIRDDLVFGARRLFECTKQIDRLQFDRPPPPPRQDDQPRSIPIQDNDAAAGAAGNDGRLIGGNYENEPRDTLTLARLSRWRLVKHLVQLERELDRAWCRTLLGPEVEDRMPPTSLLGGIWLYFLGTGEERFLLRSVANVDDHNTGPGLDVESIAAQAVDNNGFNIVEDRSN